jgi:hypothetical protein
MRALILAAASAALLAAPAAFAQPSEAPPAPPPPSDSTVSPAEDPAAPPAVQQDVQRQEAWLAQQIGDGRGRQMLDNIRAEHARLAASHGGGLTQSDARYLEARLGELAGRLGLSAPPA